MTIRRVHAEARTSPHPPTMKPCETCGREFKVHACTEARGGGKFCSIDCRNTSYRGVGNPKWRGGRVNDTRGRVMVYAPGNPDARLMGGNYIYEYRLIAASTLGRSLSEDEIVHHINGNHTDNRPENLEVMSQSEHLKRHLPEMRKKVAS